MSTEREVENVITLAREINELSPPDRLRLAAQLIEAGKFNLAHTIVEKVTLEMGAARLLATKGKL